MVGNVASIALVCVIVVIVLLGVTWLMYNIIGPAMDRRGRDHDDRMLFTRYCLKGWLHRYLWLNRRIPSDPRCKMCYAPFGGVGRVLGNRPSRKNSNFCRSCFEAVPMGGHQMEVGVLFADLRGFTAWSGDHTPERVAAALGDFYRLATHALMAHDAVIDKFVGDEVMALFLSEMSSLGEHTCDEMLAAAQEMLAASKLEAGALGVGIGLHYGPAWVGNVGSGEIKDFTALGDVVNVASRLQGCAQPGQIAISEEAFARLADPLAAEATSFSVKGKTEPLAVHIVAAIA